MTWQFFRSCPIAILTLLIVTIAQAVAPPVDHKLTQADRQFLDGLKEFLFDPIGAKWVVVRVIPGTAERMGWLKTITADGTAKVYFTDGASTTVPMQLVTPIDFTSSCKEFLQPTGKHMKAEPIDSVERAGQGFPTWRAGVDQSSLVLAAWLYRLGQERLAARALARMADRNRILTGLRGYLAHSAYASALYGFTWGADEEALAHGDRLLRLYSNEAGQRHPQGYVIVEDLKRRKREGTFGQKVKKLPENLDRWEIKKQIIYLIAALEDVAEPTWSGGFVATDDAPMAALIAIGEPAIPALIGVVEKDKRLTRQRRFTEGPLRPQSILPVREAALRAIDSILRPETPFSFSVRGGSWISDDELAREMARKLRAYTRTHGRLTFDERMMKILTDPMAASKDSHNAAMELALLGKRRGSVDTMTSGAISRRENDRKRGNRTIAKFHKPTVGEAILAAMDRELTAHDARRHGKRERREIEDVYLRALHELNDTRLTIEAAKRCHSAKGRMRYEWAYLCHCLHELRPLAAFANDFEKGNVKLPDGEEGKHELHRIVLYLAAAATRESDRALHALADRKHPAHHVARRVILAERQRALSQSEDGVWFRHPYCLTILRQALEDTTPTGVIYKVDRTMLKSGSRTEERVCDAAAMQLTELIFGLDSYHPLLEESDKRFGEIKAFLDRFKGRFQRATGTEEDLLDIHPNYITYIPNIRRLKRPATEEDVKAGRAVFHFGGKSKPAPPLFPASGALEDRRALIVQAEIGPDGSVTYGVISHNGLRKIPSAKVSDIRAALVKKKHH
jgi:hypothetical protein